MHRIDGSNDRFAVRVQPHRLLYSSLVIPGNRDCAQDNAICSRGGEQLKNKLVISVAPFGKGPARHPPGETNRPMVDFHDEISHGGEGAGLGALLVTLDRAYNEPVSFTIATVDLHGLKKYAAIDKATEHTDYVKTIQNYTFAPNQQITFPDVEILDDDIVEHAETFGILIYDVSSNADIQGELNFNDTKMSLFGILDDDQ